MSVSTCPSLSDVFLRLLEAEPRRSSETEARRARLSEMAYLIPAGCYIKGSMAAFSACLDATLVFSVSHAFYTSARSFLAEMCPGNAGAYQSRSVTLGRVHAVVLSDKQIVPALDCTGTSRCMDLAQPCTYWLTRLEKLALIICVVFTNSVDSVDKTVPPTASSLVDAFSREPSNKFATHHTTYTRTFATQPVFDSLLYDRHATPAKLTTRHAMLALLCLVNTAIKYDFTKSHGELVTETGFDRLPDNVKRVPQGMYIGFCKLLFRRLSPSTLAYTTDYGFKTTCISLYFRDFIEASPDLRDLLNTAVSLCHRLFDLIVTKRSDLGSVFNNKTGKRLEHSYRNMMPVINTIPSVPTAVKALMGSIDNLPSLLEFVPCTALSLQDMMMRCVNVMDTDVYAASNDANTMFVLLECPGVVAATVGQAVNMASRYMIQPGAFFVSDFFHSAHERSCVTLGHLPQTLFFLNLLLWCCNCAVFRCKHNQSSLALVPGPHHIAYLLNHEQPALATMGAFAALMGTTPPESFEKHAVALACEKLLVVIGSGAHKCMEGATLSSTRMQDTALLLLNPFSTWLIYNTRVSAVRLYLDDTNQQNPVFDDETMKVYSLDTALLAGRDASHQPRRETQEDDPSKRSVVHTADTRAFSRDHDKAWVVLSHTQRLACLQLVQRLFEEDKASAAWSVLSYLTLKVPAGAEYMDKVFPRDACGERGEKSLGSMCQKVASRHGHPSPVAPPVAPTATTTATATEVSETRRALLVMIMCAFGHFKSFEAMAKQERQSSLHANKLTVWFEQHITSDKFVFYPFCSEKSLPDAALNARCQALQCSMMMPVTSDTACGFSPLTLSLIDEFEGLVAPQHLQQVNQLIGKSLSSNSHTVSTVPSTPRQLDMGDSATPIMLLRPPPPAAGLQVGLLAGKRVASVSEGEAPESDKRNRA